MNRDYEEKKKVYRRYLGSWEKSLSSFDHHNAKKKKKQIIFYKTSE